MTRALATRLAELKSQQLYRNRITLDSPQGVEVVVTGQTLLSFCSNDYLGLANHPALIHALEQGARQYGVGSGASHLVSGHSRPHRQLEEALAEFTGRPRALLFSSGYMANLAVIATLATRHDVIFADRLNHASLIDAAQLSQARHKRYPHGDSTALSHMIDNRMMDDKQRRSFIVSDGVFSMDGDIAPLPELLAIAARHPSRVIIDDAHGLGVIGRQGRGTLEHYHIDHRDELILVGTFGKAFGSCGAFVAASDELIETLIQLGRSYIYTTALPPAIACATLASLKLVQQQDERREQLAGLIDYFRTGAKQLSLPVMDSVTPIQPLLIGAADRAATISAALRQRGILLTAIRPPTVPEGSARLRITLSATHRREHIDRLLDTLSRLL